MHGTGSSLPANVSSGFHSNSRESEPLDSTSSSKLSTTWNPASDSICRGHDEASICVTGPWLSG
jgi:hypothetical protein